MRQAAADVSVMSKSLERWCPVYTPLWPHEIGGFVDLRLIEHAHGLGLNIISECVDDPSSKGARLNFWGLLDLCVISALGEPRVARMIRDDTLMLWLDQMEALVAEFGEGVLSIQIADRITHDHCFDPVILSKEDWDCLSTVFKETCVLMAEFLHLHRIRSRSFERRARKT